MIFTESKVNNWDRIFNDPFDDIVKSNNYRDIQKISLDVRSVDTEEYYRKVADKYSVFKTPPKIKALSDLFYITFRRNGIPDYSELEKLINKFDDDNTIYLNELKNILIDFELDKKEKIWSFKEILSHEEKIEITKQYNKLKITLIDLLNSKITKLGLKKLEYPSSIYERELKRHFSITSNYGDIEDILSNLLELKLTSISIFEKVKNKDLEASNFNGLCNSTSENCIFALRKIGIDAYPYNVYISVKSPVENKLMCHYVCVVNINNILYILDMPQIEFITNSVKIKKGFKYIKDFTPRFIEINVENLMKNYKINEETASKNIKWIFDTKINNYSMQDYISDTMI